MNELAKNPGPILIFMHEIGVLTLGIGVATMLAAKDQIRNFAIILMLYVVSLGSIGTSLYHILFFHVASGEWTTIAVIALQLAILTFLYPWKNAQGLLYECMPRDGRRH